MPALDQLATIYARTPPSGRYSTVVKQNLQCRLVPLNVQAPQAAGARAELMAIRDLFWDASYVMPENVQVLVDGTRWQPQAGTFTSIGLRNAAPKLRKAQVVRQI
jgi:hypothetical protein